MKALLLPMMEDEIGISPAAEVTLLHAGKVLEDELSVRRLDPSVLVMLEAEAAAAGNYEWTSAVLFVVIVR
jgi:hypothetical protein